MLGRRRYYVPRRGLGLGLVGWLGGRWFVLVWLGFLAVLVAEKGL